MLGEIERLAVEGEAEETGGLRTDTDQPAVLRSVASDGSAAFVFRRPDRVATASTTTVHTAGNNSSNFPRVPFPPATLASTCMWRYESGPTIASATSPRLPTNMRTPGINNQSRQTGCGVRIGKNIQASNKAVPTKVGSSIPPAFTHGSADPETLERPTWARPITGVQTKAFTVAPLTTAGIR